MVSRESNSWPTSDVTMTPHARAHHPQQLVVRPLLPAQQPSLPLLQLVFWQHSAVTQTIDGPASWQRLDHAKTAHCATAVSASLLYRPGHHPRGLFLGGEEAIDCPLPLVVPSSLLPRPHLYPTRAQWVRGCPVASLAARPVTVVHRLRCPFPTPSSKLSPHPSPSGPSYSSLNHSPLGRCRAVPLISRD